jgi:hypothetical protein
MDGPYVAQIRFSCGFRENEIENSFSYMAGRFWTVAKLLAYQAKEWLCSLELVYEYFLHFL